MKMTGNKEAASSIPIQLDYLVNSTFITIVSVPTFNGKTTVIFHDSEIHISQNIPK